MDYSKLVQVYSELENTTKSLKKTSILAEFIKKLNDDDLKKVILLIQGKLFPDWSDKEIGIGLKLVLKALSSSSGINSREIEKEWSKIGDIGLIAEKIIKNKKQSTLFSKKNSISEVFNKLRKISEIEGQGAVDKKLSLIKDLLSGASAKESKYILRTCLGDLRVGVGAGVLRDAIASAFNVKKENVQQAYDLTSDFTQVALTAKEKGDSGLQKININLGNPLKVMLFQKEESFEKGFERVGKPAAIEYKYDGFRLQIHKKSNHVKLFTRRQENVTKQFPDIVETIRKQVKANNCILDAEIIGYDKKTGKWLPFQSISQRIKRKYHVEELVKKIPVIIMIFDIVFIDGRKLTSEKFSERRKIIENVIKQQKYKIEIAEEIITSDINKAKKFYEQSLKKGNEGVMMKNLDAPYKPGSRVGYGIKIKPIMDSLELVIVGAEWGSGKRAGWLTSFELACVDSKTNEFLTIGKISTGVKEKKEEGTSYEEITNILKPLIIKQSGKEVVVKPEIVIEVGYEEIQKSPSYSSGYALRFPRFIKLREDRIAEEADSLERVEKLFNKQRFRK